MASFGVYTMIVFATIREDFTHWSSRRHYFATAITTSSRRSLTFSSVCVGVFRGLFIIGQLNGIFASWGVITTFASQLGVRARYFGLTFKNGGPIFSSIDLFLLAYNYSGVIDLSPTFLLFGGALGAPCLLWVIFVFVFGQLVRQFLFLSGFEV